MEEEVRGDKGQGEASGGEDWGIGKKGRVVTMKEGEGGRWK